MLMSKRVTAIGSRPLLDGVYTTNRHGKQWFHYINAPTSGELTALVHTISHRIAVGEQSRDCG
jgi:ABC-type cobalt transport system substrate-binding protein